MAFPQAAVALQGAALHSSFALAFAEGVKGPGVELGLLWRLGCLLWWLLCSSCPGIRCTAGPRVQWWTLWGRGCVAWWCCSCRLCRGHAVDLGVRALACSSASASSSESGLPLADPLLGLCKIA